MSKAKVEETGAFEKTSFSVMISAGKRHTIGLNSNGTVVATGNYHNDQLDITDWRDIVAMSARFDFPDKIRNGNVGYRGGVYGMLLLERRERRWIRSNK